MDLVTHDTTEIPDVHFSRPVFFITDVKDQGCIDAGFMIVKVKSALYPNDE